jgi:hypothetical protein
MKNCLDGSTAINLISFNRFSEYFLVNMKEEVHEKSDSLIYPGGVNGPAEWLRATPRF